MAIKLKTQKLDSNSKCFWLSDFRFSYSGDKCVGRNILYFAAMVYLAEKQKLVICKVLSAGYVSSKLLPA